MTLKNLLTPQDVYEWMDENIEYGWLDLNGQIHINEMKNFRRLYRTMSIDEILHYKVGTCIEQVFLMHTLLDEEEHMHCFILFYQNGKVYHLEHPNKEKKGVYEYASENAAIETIVQYYVRLRGGKESPTTAFDEVPPNLSFGAFQAFVNHLEDNMEYKRTTNSL